MAQAAPLELSHALALELHGLFRALEQRIHAPDLVREQLEAASRKLDELEAELSRVPEAVAQSIERVSELIRDWSLDDTERWAELRAQFKETYAGLSTALRGERVLVPDLRPANTKRSLFHVISGLVCLGLIVLLTREQLPWAAAAFAGTAWLLEGLRRLLPAANDWLLHLFRGIVRERERPHVNSSTWYMTALVLLALTYSPLVCVTAVAVLGVGDPVAALVGRRWGRIELVHSRSLEGTLAFVVVATLAARAAMLLLDPAAGSGALWLVALVAALAGGLAELLSRRVDDNFSVPMVSAIATATMMMLLGIPW